MAAMSLLGCNSSKSTQQDSSAQPIKIDSLTIVGNDKDEHGCIASAGYTWSVVKDSCIRLWETGILLKSVEVNQTYNADAVIILSADKTQAELFLPTQKESIILNRTKKQGKYSWIKDNIELSSSKGYSLIQEGKLTFSKE